MNQTENIDKTVRRYLLGQLSEPDQAAIESEYFANRERFEEVCAIENDLIDDYVRGNLPGAEREQFEQRYFSQPEKLRRVQFAGTMLSSIYGVPASAGTKPAQPAPAPPRLRATFARILGQWGPRTAPALASFALMLMAAVVLLGLECIRLKQRLTASQQMVAAESQREQELERQLGEQQASNVQLANDLDALRSQEHDKKQEQQNPPGDKLSPIVAAFTLRPGLIRGSGGPQVLTVAPTVDVIELRLDLGSTDFKGYSANLQTPEGIVVWQQADVKARPYKAGRKLVIRLPGKALAAGDYLLSVRGLSSPGEPIEVGDYYFKIARKAAR